MAQLSIFSLTIPGIFHDKILRAPKSMILRTITARVSSLTMDHNVFVAGQEYECETVPIWTIEEVQQQSFI